MEKLYYSIGEVAQMLGESTSCIRFWSNSFPNRIKPQRNAKGNRKFTPKDIEVLRQAEHLLKTKGMTIEGTARMLDGEDKINMDRVKALDTLKDIRRELVEIRNSLK